MRTYLVTSLFVLLVFLVSGQSVIPVALAADGLNPESLLVPNWDRRKNLVGREGLEPSTNGLKVRCSTT